MLPSTRSCEKVKFKYGKARDKTCERACNKGKLALLFAKEMAILKRAGKLCAEGTSDITELEGIRGHIAGADN